MKPFLTYSDDSEQELFLQTNVEKFQIKAATVASSPDKPNEDAFTAIYEEPVLIVGIFDGTTSLKSIKSLGEQTGAHFASHFLRDTFAQIKNAYSPKELLQELNRQLLKKSLEFEGATMDDTHTLPSSTGTIIEIDREKQLLTFAHVGDTYCILYFSDGHSKLVTDDKNGKFDTKMFALIDKIAKEKNISPREARQDEQVKKALLQMFNERNNNPQGTGSGVINGDPHVELYIQAGEVNLKGVTEILLGTDGLLPQGWSEQNEEDRKKLFNEIHNGGFKKLFQTKKESENADPDWYHIRYKHSDDATGILLQF